MAIQEEATITQGLTQTYADIVKEKRREYQRQYYAKQKEINKLRKVLNSDVSQANLDTQKVEKRKAYKKEYYLQQKEKKKMKPMAPISNAEEISRRTPLTTRSTTLEKSQMDTQLSQRLPLTTLQNRITNISDLSYANEVMKTGIYPSPLCNLRDGNKENETPLETPFSQEPNIEEASSMVDNLSYKRKIANKKYYQRTKEKIILTSITRTTRTSQTHPFSTLTNKSLSGIQRESNMLLPLFNSVSGEPLTTGVTTIEEDPFDFVYDGIPQDHRVLKKQNPCVHCGAFRFKFEYPSFCCMKGKTELASSTVPDELYHLFTVQSEVGEMFRHNIRSYNTNFSFTSMGVNLDKRLANSESGVYTFRVMGGIYHSIDQLVPRDGKPRYLQLYFYDADTEVSQRLEWPNLDISITGTLSRVLATNPYVSTFRSMAELGPLDNYRVNLNASVELDQRVYNRPTTSEVAGIWVEGNDNITSFKRSIIVYGRSAHSQRIQPHYGCYDPLSYPLFFPNGEPGWHSKVPRHGVSINEVLDDNENVEEQAEDSEISRGRTTVTMREYYAYKFQIRPAKNLLLLGGRLLQQFVVDIYIKIETSRLLFVSRNQSKIRSDLYQGIVDCVNAGEVQPSRVGQRVVLPASFIGGPRDMRRRFLDAMTLVQEDGKPDIFLTMTCNPKWDEIKEKLLPGQTAQDRPGLVARAFRAKLEDLKEQLFKKHILGKVGAHVYVIEFQKRGLPHAHFLLIMEPGYKLTTPDHYDNIVCAEIPNPIKYPKMHALVVKHMIHGPCGNLGRNNSCMQGEPKKCRWKYPRQFNETTIQGKDSYPLYRRRNNGITVNVRNKALDNRWVVPYNPKLLMMFNCHMNVEVCSSIQSVKYVFKYVYKGHDKQVVHIDPDEEEVVVNEIKRFQDARYVSPPEAMWRIFGFPLSQIHPYVMALHLHLPNKQLVRFRENDTMTDTVDREKDKRSMLTSFFDMNKVDEVARECLYRDFPTKFTWDAGKRRWHRRKGQLMRGRLVSANPAEGERYYMRVLLSHVKGPTYFEDLYTVNGVLYSTFRKAALERGLIENDDNLSQCLMEASTFQFPSALRRLFATILIFEEPGDVRKLWNDHYESLFEDYRRQCNILERVQNMVLTDIRVFLQSMSKNIDDFDLPTITTDINLESSAYREVQEECSIVVEDDHLRDRDYLNSDQKAAYDSIMRHVNENFPGLFFIDGPGGTGKTFLYKVLLAVVRSRGHIALATASSGAAANNMPGGRTAHSRFKIPINLDNNSMCNIKKQSGTAQLLQSAKVIIWDEKSMAKRQAIEAVDRTLQDITGVRLPFGGKIMVLGGDFRQVLPVVRRGTRAQIVDSSLRMSPLWPVIKKMPLTINMRARTDPWFSNFLLRVGDGEEDAIEDNFIRIPNDMAIPYTNEAESKDALINAIFPSLQVNANSSDYITSRAILSTKNDNVDQINDKMIDRFCGEEKTYYSFDVAEDDRNNFYPMEFLNSLNVSGLPPHILRLKIGCPIILLRNINPSDGLCNGTRLICRAFLPNVIDAEIAIGQHAGKRVFLSRIPLCPSEADMFPFKLKRKQIPVRLSFAMTINKAQGQTIPNVGVYLPDSVFSHGQLYVALSRGTSRANTKVLVKPVKKFTEDGVYTSNVVYQEVLGDA